MVQVDLILCPDRIIWTAISSLSTAVQDVFYPQFSCRIQIPLTPAQVLIFCLYTCRCGGKLELNMDTKSTLCSAEIQFQWESCTLLYGKHILSFIIRTGYLVETILQELSFLLVFYCVFAVHSLAASHLPSPCAF